MLRLLTINIAAFSNVSANWTILSLVIGLNKSYFNFRRAVKRREYDQTINYDPYAATDGWHIDDIRDDALYIHIPHHVAGLRSLGTRVSAEQSCGMRRNSRDVPPPVCSCATSLGELQSLGGGVTSGECVPHSNKLDSSSVSPEAIYGGHSCDRDRRTR